MKHSFRIFVLLLIIFISACSGNPKIPGETEQNPLRLTARDHIIDPKKANKKYLAILGIPLTAFYSFNYKKNKPASEENAEHFYFPVIPPDFDVKKDPLTIFVYASPKEFRDITDNLKKFYKLMDEPRLTRGYRAASKYEVPESVLRTYENNQIIVAPRDKRITIHLTAIDKKAEKK
jgi:hypothetical protein